MTPSVGKPVGQEDQVGGALAIGQAGCFEQGALDVGAALGALPVHPSGGFGGLGGRLELAGVAFQPGAEGDDVKTIL